MANAARKARRQLSWNRCHGPNGKKDMRVFKSSHGKFGSVAELEANRKKVTKDNKIRKAKKVIERAKRVRQLELDAIEDKKLAAEYAAEGD